MSVDVSTFLANYPDFVGIPVPQLEAAIADAAEIHCPASTWEINGSTQRRDRAIMLVAAHHLEEQRLQQAATGGAVTSVASGNSGSVNSGGGEPWMSTAYGRQFQELRRTNASRIGFSL